jgi:hypothetical protein
MRTITLNVITDSGGRAILEILSESDIVSIQHTGKPRPTLIQSTVTLCNGKDFDVENTFDDIMKQIDEMKEYRARTLFGMQTIN